MSRSEFDVWSSVIFITEGALPFLLLAEKQRSSVQKRSCVWAVMLFSSVSSMKASQSAGRRPRSCWGPSRQHLLRQLHQLSLDTVWCRRPILCHQSQQPVTLQCNHKDSAGKPYIFCPKSIPAVHSCHISQHHKRFKHASCGPIAFSS